MFVLQACLEADGEGPLEESGGLEGGADALSPFTHTPNSLSLPVPQSNRGGPRDTQEGRVQAVRPLYIYAYHSLSVNSRCVRVWAVLSACHPTTISIGYRTENGVVMSIVLPTVGRRSFLG